MVDGFGTLLELLLVCIFIVRVVSIAKSYRDGGSLRFTKCDRGILALRRLEGRRHGSGFLLIVHQRV